MDRFCFSVVVEQRRNLRLAMLLKHRLLSSLSTSRTSPVSRIVNDLDRQSTRGCLRSRPDSEFASD